jgi:hypothetical protein
LNRFEKLIAESDFRFESYAEVADSEASDSWQTDSLVSSLLQLSGASWCPATKMDVDCTYSGLKTELLHPVDKGGKIRTYNMLKELRRDHEITYLHA